MKSIKIFSVFVLIACLLISFFQINNSVSVLANAKPKNSKKIIIDAGHGGFDGGAIAIDGTVEKDINLNISLYLKDFLEAAGYTVIATRTTDTATDGDLNSSISARKTSDLKNRLNLMSKNDDAIFVSVHLNKFTSSSASGAQVFYSKNNNQSKILGQKIQDSFKNMLQKDNERVIKMGSSSTYLLHKAQIPAVIVECGFLSNLNELEKLKDKDYQTQIAFCIFCGIMNYENNMME